MNDDVVLAPAGLWTPGGLANYLHVSKRQLWRLRDAGALPPPVTVGGSPRCLRWRMDVIREWVTAGMPDVRRTGWTPSK